jgi:hypothetical protein
MICALLHSITKDIFDLSLDVAQSKCCEGRSEDAILCINCACSFTQLNADLLHCRIRPHRAVLFLCVRSALSASARKSKESLAATGPVRLVDRTLLHHHNQSLSTFDLAVPLHCSAMMHSHILDYHSFRKPPLLYWTRWVSAT